LLEQTSPLTELTRALATGTTTPTEVAASVARNANTNASHNTYIHFDLAALDRQVEHLSHLPPADPKPTLFAIPISLKDCFDLAGTVTTCGAKFYADHSPPATEDSAMAARLHASGAIITGKTHLHPLAYGITGQNPYYRDCLQPRDSSRLTGGSSSGAAASVQEGSALAAIGTDTGGSIRVPAALCGLAGYRASHGLAYAPGPWPASPRGLWEGASHLAPAFDTPGILLRDPRDAAPLAHVLFGVPFAPAPTAPRIGCVDAAFLSDCEPDVLAAFQAWRQQIEQTGGTVTEFDTAFLTGAQEAFAGIQAHEAAALHAGHFDEFESAIAQRLHWGASLTNEDLAPFEQRRTAIRAAVATLFTRFDFLMLPCAPVSRLVAADDQSSVRHRILRYTTPFSLAAVPVFALPGEIIGAPLGTGVQIAAPPAADPTLLAYAASLAQSLVDKQSK
jgi:Asp-tRNA(Asn)/Glu-tRNA(Gln) amidotransferase A subunit family amidase